ncbi:MAG TPA: ATP-binding protein [Puia sp.]|nr:ATP-binding protein [Puia sp.]
MKKIIFLFLAVILWRHNNAQTNKIDSLKKLLTGEKTDTARVILLSQMSYEYENSKPDSSLLLAEQGLRLAKKNNFTQGEISCLNMIGLCFMTIGNYPKALEYLLESLKKSEAINDKRVMVTTLINIGVVCSAQGDYRLGTNHQLQALSIVKALSLPHNTAIVLLNLGDNYEKLNMLDSAIYYTGQCYVLSKEIKDSNLIGIVLNNFGNIYSTMGKPEAALTYYRSDLLYLRQAADNDDLCETYLGMAKIFKESKAADSCLYYAKLALQIANLAGFTDEVMKASHFLTLFYTATHNVDSAFAYQSASIIAKDSLFNQEKAKEMQTLQFDEAIRQQQIAEAAEQAHTQLKLNALVGGLATLLIAAFLLYRNNRQKQKAFLTLMKQQKETDIQKSKAEQALLELKSAQSLLIQSEKMASLGELTAGIAHEIQNPLNFVNNFSDLNIELGEEVQSAMTTGSVEEAKSILSDIIKNEKKINHHGKKADAIVKGMLQHSRSSTGVKELTDINALADEYFRLAYHGLRAKDNSFDVTMKTDFDERIGKINIIPQDIGRVLLNIYNNAFYAVQEKFKAEGAGYKPVISVSTGKIEKQLFISVSDNGRGIPQKVVDKIFQPFFTTKPTGQGTGLGLSLSYDIVKAHGGDIRVETMEGERSEFIIQLPL